MESADSWLSLVLDFHKTITIRHVEALAKIRKCHRSEAVEEIRTAIVDQVKSGQYVRTPHLKTLRDSWRTELDRQFMTIDDKNLKLVPCSAKAARKIKKKKNRAARIKARLKNAGLRPTCKVKPRPPKEGSRKRIYLDYLASPEWKVKRQEALECHGRLCNRCGSLNNLHVHHKTYKRLMNEEMRDLEILCKSCHFSHHLKEDKRKGRIR